MLFIADPIFQVILYGVALAIYSWRYASNPPKLSSANEETGSVQPSSLSDPITEPRDSSPMEHLSGLLLPLPSASPRDSCRESTRKSRLGKRLPDHFF